MKSPVFINGVNYAYGEGPLRRQVLFDINAEIRRGEILILTGPSGSGKTTLLTLIGALRSPQEGSLRVLGQELTGGSGTALAEVRKRIGYIFQAHNLLEALTAQQNVQVTLQLHPELNGREIESRAAQALSSVGLGDRLAAHPSELSGGERQRVAIARALAAKPELLLADEPTASLDKKTGRDLVELIQRLAKQDGVTVILVTHDNRILDVADRILTLEDGRLSSLMSSITSESQHMMHLLAEDLRKGHLSDRLARMRREQFETFLEEITHETRKLLEVAELVQGKTFGSIEREVVVALEQKLADMLHANRAVLYFVDPDKETLQACRSDSNDLRKEWELNSIGGVVGHVLKTGESLSSADVGSLPQFDPTIDGPDTVSVLAVPIRDSAGHVFAVIELRDKSNGQGFSADDEKEITGFAESLGTLVESWWQMACGCRRGAMGRKMECCPPTY